MPMVGMGSCWVSSFATRGVKLFTYDVPAGNWWRGPGEDDFGGPALEGCNEMLCLTRPELIAELHRSFFEVGCRVVETDSFGSLPWVLAEYGMAGRTRELAVAAASIARDVADGYGPGHFVAGSLGPGTKIASLGQISFADMRDGYQEAAAGLIAGGVDLLLIETVQDLLQAKAAVIGTTDYHGRFTSALAQDNIAACQFHPERSGRVGLRVLDNFLSWNP